MDWRRIHKFDGSKARRGPGRPRVPRAVEQLIVRMAEENRDWGYDRIAGALANLGYLHPMLLIINDRRREGRGTRQLFEAARAVPEPAKE
jgi:hypothetical protein